MKFKKLLFSTTLLLPFFATAQKSVVPEVKVVNERNAQPMQLQDLSVDIFVVGQTAVTTMEMTFYNPNSRVMEGEFQFPLADGQQVSRFALDINGKMREGVVVDKTLGRKAFEDIVRRGVDPGLLEKTEGNNFKARVYPMPAKGSRRILIAFEQELLERNGQDFYFLPINANLTLKNFNIRTEVVSRMVKADIQNSLQLDFQQTRNSYISQLSKQNYTLNQSIALTFPKVDKPQIITATQGTHTYAYANMGIGKQPYKSKPTPKTLAILWDVSHSAAKRDQRKEIEFLDAYFSQVKNLKVILNTFHIRTAPSLTFEVKNGDWEALKHHLQSLQYEGATDANAIPFTTQCDEYFLFTDGIFNFGAKEFELDKVAAQIKTPVSVINTSLVANTTKMQFLAATTGGSWVDLTTRTLPDALVDVRTVPFRLLDITVKTGKVANIFPEKGIALSQPNLSFSAELLSEEATLLVSVGYSNQPIVQKELLISANPNASKTQFELLRRIWAEKQIAQLQRFGADQKQIDALGRQYGIVTEGNSLIVLETVDDYLRYRITPPEELLQEYSKRLAIEKTQKEDEVKNRIEHLLKQSEAQTQWWKTDYPIKGTNPKIREEDSYAIMELSSSNQELAEEVVVAGYSNSRRRQRTASPPPPPPANRPLATEASQSRMLVYEESMSADMAKKDETFSEEALPSAVSSPEITLNAYNPDTPYLKVMEYTDENQALATYYRLKKEYGNTPAFYVDIADYFFKKGNAEQAILVVSTLAELALDDPQLLRMLGYKLSSYGAKKEAIQVFRKVAELREEEPQSFRDLALALADDAQFDEAAKNLYKVVVGNWNNRFGDVCLVTLNDLNSLIAQHKTINVSYMDKRLIKKEPVDVRVVLSWDTDNCDMDLWVTDPKGEKCWYNNPKTYLGGKISRDVTQGYGPEEFMLKKAPKGDYKVEVNYFGTTSQKQLLPISLRITFYTNFGSTAQKEQEITVRLNNAKDLIEVGKFEF